MLGVRISDSPANRSMALRFSRGWRSRSTVTRIFRPRQSLLGLARPTDRMPRSHQLRPALAIAGPWLGPERRALERTADHARHDQGPPVIEPDEMRCTRPDAVAHRPAIAVHDPGLRPDRLGHAVGELIGVLAGQIALVRLPVDGIKLDMRRGKPRRDGARQRGLAGARCPDHHDAHGRIYAWIASTITMCVVDMSARQVAPLRERAPRDRTFFLPVSGERCKS